MDKNIIKSKTFWLGIITAVLPLWPPAAEWLVANMGIFNGVWGALIIGLRLITKDKVVLLP